MELTDSTNDQLGETRSAAGTEDNRSFLGIDLNEFPSLGGGCTAGHDDDAEYEPIEVVRSIHDNPDPPPGASAEVPGPDRHAACGACGRPESTELVFVCDACERGFHLCCVDDGVEEAPSAEWMCSDCVTGGERSKRWPLGVKSKLILDMNASPPSDAEGYGVEETSDSRQHMLASSSCMGSSSEQAMTHSSFLSPGRGHATLEASGIMACNTKMGMDALGSHALGFGFPLNLSNSSLPVRFPSLDPSELCLQNLRQFISERHGVLEDGWRVVFKKPLNGYHLCAVYCAPNGKTFSSVRDVACYLGLEINGNYSCMNAEIRNEGSLHQERLHMPKRRKTSRWPDNGFPERKSSSAISQPRRFPFETMSAFAFKSDTFADSGESLSSGKNGCCCEEANNGLPMQFEDFFVLSLGRIDIRQPYHNVNMIYPIGYKSCWHDKITGSLFTCEISDGSSGPVFKVTRSPCSKSFIPTGSTVFSCPQIDELVEQSQYKRGDNKNSTQEYGDDSDVEILLSDPCPPVGDDILSCLHEHNISETFNCLHSMVGSSQVEFDNILSYNQEHGVEIGDIVVEEDSLPVAWKNVSQKLVDACSNILKQKGTMNFHCKHVDKETREINWDTMGEKDNVILSLSRFCCSLAPRSVTSGENDKSKNASLVDFLSRWLDQNRFGLDAEFVQEMIEDMPGAESCSKYKSLKSRGSSSASVTVAEGALVVKPRGGEYVKEEVFGEFYWKAKKPKLKGSHGVGYPHPPPGRPMCLRLPPGRVGDFLQVSEVFWRFHDILGLEESFSPEKLEQELIIPVFDSLFIDKSGKEDIRNEINFSDKDCIATKMVSLFNESHQPLSSENTSASLLKETRSGDSSEFKISYSSRGTCLGPLLTRTHISLLQVLICELQSKVAAFVDPNFDSGESRSRRGRKKDDSTLSSKRNKLHMLPLNEFTWPELARRYLLSLLSMDGNLESSEIAARESGKVFRCLQGDGGLLCGSLTGVAGMEADSMLLAEAIKKIFGSLPRENDVLSVEDDDFDGLDATETNACNGDIPEWAQVLEPVKKLPTNVGTRIRKCVYEALEKNPPEWAKKILEHSISKEVYKGNASGPTKKAVLLLLSDVRGGDLVQRSVKATKKRTLISVSDIIMKKCRAVLREIAAADEDKVFCTLLGRKLLKSSDNDDDGLLGSPAMVSRPLDFRTIDLRLAAGAYDGSTEAFLEDVLELWNSIRAMYADQTDCVELVETLSEKFKSLYEAEVLPLVQKLKDYRKLECPSPETKKEMKDIVASTNKLPKAPWDEGVCKVCGVDKDDDSVLLCDTCDAEYHTYCLNPPLIRIPDGNWYCPSCVIAKSMSQDALESYKLVRRRKGRKYQGELTRASMETTAHLANVMEEKDYWEFSAEERILLLKLLSDELLSSSLVHQHLEQCAEAIIEMQQKLRCLSSEWKNAKTKQEFLMTKLAKVEPSDPKEGGEPQNSSHFADHIGCDQRPQEGVGGRVTHADETSYTPLLNKNQGKASLESDAHPGELHVNSDESKIFSPEKVTSHGRHKLPVAGVTDNLSSEKDTSETLHNSVGRNHETHTLKSNAVELETAHDETSEASQELKACQQDLNATNNEMQNLQQSIRSIESQLLKQSIRRDFLGSDAIHRLYWGCCFPDENPRILVDGSMSLEKSVQADLTGSEAPSPFLHAVYPGRVMLSPWMYYETEAEISELVQWLHDTDPKERELKESILGWRRLRFGDLRKEVKRAQNSSSPILATCLVTKAAMSMEKRYGPCIKLETKTLKKTKVAEREKLYRCECLESILPSMVHCLICHNTFASDTEFEEHTESRCTPYSLATAEGKEISDSSKAKESLKSNYLSVKSSASKDLAEISNVSELDSGLIRYQEEESISPYHFEEICSKFLTKDSNRELVKEIGLIGSNGIPTFLPLSSTHFNESVLISSTSNKLDGGDSGDQVIFTGSEANGEGFNSESNTSCDKVVADDIGGSLNNPSGLCFGFSEQKNKKSSGSGLEGCCVVPQASLKRITGSRALPVFSFLKTNLLDMEVALPEEALRPSKSHFDRRRAWRAFVKSAQSIYELVQATIVVEDMIKTEYLRNEWWYWSSLSAAAKVSTLSALSLRIFSLDAAIMYEKTINQSDPMDETKPMMSLQDQKSQQPVSDSQERSSRANRRYGKKRKEPEGS